MTTKRILILLLLASRGFAQLPGALIPWVNLQFTDNNGQPLALGKVCTYQAGTNLKSPTYTTAALTTQNSDPIILDSSGRASIFIGPTPLKVVIQNPGDNNCPGTGSIIRSIDNIQDNAQILKSLLASGNGSSFIGYTAGGAGAVPETVQAKLRQVVNIEDFGANIIFVDNSSALSKAMAAACGGGPGTVNLSAIYPMRNTTTWTGQNCFINGQGQSTGFLCNMQTSATDCIVYSFATQYGGGNGMKDLLMRAGNTNVRRLFSFVNQTGFLMDNVTTRSGNLAGVTALYVSGGVVSNVNNSRFLDGGSGSTVVVAASPALVTTTLTFNGGNVETSTGPCLDLGGSSGAASIVVQNMTIEGCAIGLKAGTNIILLGNHFEHNTSSITVPDGTGALIQSGFNNFEQCAGVGGTVFTLKPGTNMSSAYDVNDLAAGCTLYAAPTGSHVYTSGPQLPNAVFPEGVLNSGDPNAISWGVLAHQSYAITDVSGVFSVQLFRGNYYDVGVSGDTEIHVLGAAVNLPAGEEIILHLTRNGSAVVSTSNSNTGDIPIIGKINPDGATANSFQDVLLRKDTSGNLDVESSPGWTTQANGSGAPVIGAVGSFTPHIAFSVSNTGVVEQFHTGTYIKIGKQVFVNLFIILSSKGSASGIASITGLPFTNGSSRTDGGFVYFYSALSGISAMPSGTMPAAGTTVFLYRPTSVSMDDTNFSNTSEINFTITYQADQ